MNCCRAMHTGIVYSAYACVKAPDKRGNKMFLYNLYNMCECVYGRAKGFLFSSPDPIPTQGRKTYK